MKVLIIAARGFEKGDDTGDFFSRAFKQDGCEVSVVSHRNVLRSNPLPQIEFFRRYFKRKANDLVLSGVRSRQPDVVVVIKGETLAPELLSEMRSIYKARFVNLFPHKDFF